MDIHARFIFEEAFYKERKEGAVSSKRISELMEKAQESAFEGALKELHPYFWITKQHFYFTHLPFYNFPYTVGYLTSLQLMRKAPLPSMVLASVRPTSSPPRETSP